MFPPLLAAQQRGQSRSGVPKTPKSGAGLERNHLPLSAEITCRFRPKSGAGLLRFLHTQQIYHSRRGASGCERTVVLECRHSRFKRRLRAGWRFVVILNPMDQRPYRPIRGAARFLNSPLWSRVLRCTALPRIAYGGALTAALLLSRYVSLSLGRFHCGTGRLCEGWRTAPRQRDWWLSCCPTVK